MKTKRKQIQEADFGLYADGRAASHSLSSASLSTVHRNAEVCDKGKLFLNLPFLGECLLRYI